MGLYVYRNSDHFETVTTKSGAFRLLASHPGIEIHEGTMVKGKQLNLLPFGDGDPAAAEAYYILCGTMRATLPTCVITVGRNDLIVTSSLKGPVIFETLEDVRFLYVCSRSTFGEVSTKLRELTHLAAEVELRDGHTAGHGLRVQSLAFATGQQLGMSHERLHDLEYGAYLHDVGKCRIPLTILTKPGALDEEEWTEMRRHSEYGMQMVLETTLRGAAKIIEQHHERFNGSGYPRGLSGDEIMPEALVVGIADTFDSLTSGRPWRPALPRGHALRVLEDAAGVLFPRDLLKAFRAAEMSMPGT